MYDLVHDGNDWYRMHWWCLYPPKSLVFYDRHNYVGFTLPLLNTDPLLKCTKPPNGKLFDCPLFICDKPRVDWFDDQEDIVISVCHFLHSPKNPF